MTEVKVYPSIEEFLKARFEYYQNIDSFVGDFSKTGLKILEWHKNWPVLVETPPVYDYDPVDTNTFRMTVHQRLAWYPEAEYIKKFGTAPPTAPILRIMVQMFSYHRDFNPEWLITDKDNNEGN